VVVDVPVREIEGCRAADERLLTTIQGLDDATVMQPSRLPGWTVGHVLAHLARNGESVVRRLDGARAGLVVDQYPGGVEGRAAEIESTATRPAAELVSDVARAAQAVQQAAAAMPNEAWGRMSRRANGGLLTAAEVMFSRWREIEIHHVDLGLGYEPAHWPMDLTRRWLADLLPSLPDRCAPQDLLAWCLQRGLAPALAAWEQS
jgi:maleylpyruvate isomerase